MVLHSRGCGRVARRRFTCWGFPSSLRSGNPVFYIPPVFFAFRPNPMRVPGRPFLFIPLFFFPLVSLTWIPACGGRVIRVPDAGEWCRSGCHPGLLRAADSPGDRGFHGLRDVADRRSVSSGYRTGVIRVPMCLPGTVATYGWRHSGTDWCHSGTNPYIRGYLIALLLVISSMDLVASPPRYREQADFLSCAKHKATHSLAEDAG